MTIEENQELLETLSNQGLLIKRDKTWGKHEWVAKMKYNDRTIKVVDCSYEHMTSIKYRKQFIFDAYMFNSYGWVFKSLKECTVDEVLLVIKNLKIQIKEQKMTEKLDRIEKDFV